MSQRLQHQNWLSSFRANRLGFPLLEALIVGITCLLPPNALANPIETKVLSSQPIGTETANTDCSTYTPIRNAIAPKESPLKKTRGHGDTETRRYPMSEARGFQQGDSHNLELATSDCAADLMEDSSPLDSFKTIGLTSTTTEEFIVQETNPDSETESPSDIPSNSEDESDRWHVKIQPYVTLPINTYGSTTVKGRTANYHLDLIELLNNLTFNINGRFEVWKSNIGFIVDASYVDLNSVQNVSRRRTTLESSLNFNQGIYDFAFSYHFGAPAQYSLPAQPSNKPFPLVWFEPIAGVRLNDINSTIEASLDFERIDRTFEKSVSKGRTWLEPMIGGKLGVQVSDYVTFWLRGDVSGFGLAGDTDLSWNIIPGMDWWVSPTISLQFGYRFYQINYGNGSGSNEFRFEENYNGPYLSATFHL